MIFFQILSSLSHIACLSKKGVKKCKQKVEQNLTLCYKTHLGICVSQLRLVALNTPLAGDLGSIHSVNKQCRLQAQAMGIRDEYRAFLSHHLQDMIDIVQEPYRTSLPIVNLRVSHLSFLICRCVLVRREGCSKALKTDNCSSHFYLKILESLPVYTFFGLSWKLFFSSFFLFYIRTHLMKCISYFCREKFFLKTGKASSPITFSLLGSHSTLLMDEMWWVTLSGQLNIQTPSTSLL